MPDRFAKIIEASYKTLRDSWSRALDEVARQYPDVAANSGLGDACFDSLIALWSVDPLPSPETLRRDRDCPGQVLLQACLGLGRNGVGLVDSITIVRHIFDVLERQLASLDWPAEEQLGSWRRLRAIRDIVEMAVLSTHEDQDQVTSQRLRPESRDDSDQARRQFEDLYLTSTNIIIITGADGCINMANPEALTLFGRDSLIGRDCCTALGMPGKGNTALQGSLAPGQTTEISIQFDDQAHHFALRAVPQTGARDGGLMVVMNDITCLVDHRQALAQEVKVRTRELERSEVMLTAILDSAGEGILVTDVAGEIQNANRRASEIFGLAWENLVGSSIHALAESSAEPAVSAILQASPRGEIHELEVPGLYVDGRRFPAFLTVTRFDLDDEVFLAFMVRDVTVQKQLEEQMRDERNQTAEMNVTLRNVLQSIENDRREAQQQLASRIRDTLLPALGKVRRIGRAEVRSSFLDLVEEQLVGLTEGTADQLDAGLLRLSRTELQVCRFIQSGVSSKAIGQAMNLSLETIQTHRKNIRRKLDLQGQRVNLHNYLTAHPPIRDEGVLDVER